MALELIAVKKPHRRKRYPPEERQKWIDDKESGMTAKAVAEKYGIAEMTFRKWHRRYQASNKNPAELISHKPGRRKSTDTQKTPDVIIEEIYRLRAEYDWGIYRIRKALMQKFGFTVSASTINNYIRSKEGAARVKEKNNSAAKDVFDKEKAFLQEKVEELHLKIEYYKEENDELKKALRELATAILYTRKDFLDFVLNRRRKHMNEIAERKNSQ